MNKQTFNGEMPQLRAVAFDQQVAASVEQSRQDFQARNGEHWDDPELLAKTDHVRLKNETIMQLIARTGINARQIADWPKITISEFCVLATDRSRQEERLKPRLEAL
jgi:hypothetical protein